MINIPNQNSGNHWKKIELYISYGGGLGGCSFDIELAYAEQSTSCVKVGMQKLYNGHIFVNASYLLKGGSVISSFGYDSNGNIYYLSKYGHSAAFITHMSGCRITSVSDIGTTQPSNITLVTIQE